MTFSPERRIAAVAVAVFILAISSREIFRLLPTDIATPTWKLGWVLLCYLGLWIVHRMRPAAAFVELGLEGPALRAVGIMCVASLPMLAVLLTTTGGAVQFPASTVVNGVLVAAVTEEVLFRGYLFRQLYRRAGWRFFPAVLTTALLFGLAHIGTVLRGNAMEVLGVVGITTAGGAFFAWLFVRWNDNLWIPIGMHLFMNLWWEICSVDVTAIGTWQANGARASAIVVAILITLRFTKRLDDRP